MGPKSRTIRISEDVFHRLQDRAKPLDDTPNSVIEELLDRDDQYTALGLGREQGGSKSDPPVERMDMMFSEPESPFSQASEPVSSWPSSEQFTEPEGEKRLEQWWKKRIGQSVAGRRIILAPASVNTQQHFENTIKGPVPLSRIRDLVTDDEWQLLMELYPNGQAQIWGARPGPRNRKNFARIKDNDIVLFYRDGTYFSSYRVTTKLGRQATELAEELWGRDSDGNTWDLIYFLSDGRAESVAVGDLWKVAGQGPKSLVRGLWILDRAPSARCIEHFELDR